jgi:hypothetical protein
MPDWPPHMLQQEGTHAPAFRPSVFIASGSCASACSLDPKRTHPVLEAAATPAAVPETSVFKKRLRSTLGSLS